MVQWPRLRNTSHKVGMSSTHPARPLITEDIPGTGGRYKEQPEDFVVQELPLYEPSGQGPHLYLWIQKRDLPAHVLLQRVCQVFGGSPREVGQAGTKDKRAVTRQWLSVLDERQQWDTSQDPGELDLGPEVQVLAWSRHGNRLRTGHLQGNLFEITLREVGPDALEHARAALERLSRRGLPNFYGEQRFGRDGDNMERGRALVQAGRVNKRDRRSRLLISAFQSELFNQVLARRMREGLLETALAGDRMMKADSHATFEVEDPALEQPRLDRREILPTGPIFGHKAPLASGQPGQVEQEVLQAQGLRLEDFRPLGKLAPGTRRPLLVMPQQTSVEPCEQGLKLRFSLPSGSYATVLLHEIMKHQDPQGEEKP